MSDAPQGPGWFQAADGKWYAPPPGAPPGGYPPGAYPPGAYPPPVVPKQSNPLPWVIGCIVGPILVMAIAVVCIAAVTLLGRNASSKFSSISTSTTCTPGQYPC